jgi:Tol biopolymer transport system component
MDAGDTNAASDVYVRDRAGDVTEIVSTADNTAATEGNSGSSYSALSADGRFVAFASSATNFVPVTPSFAHVFRKDRTTDDTIVVSREPDGDVLSQSSTAPKISADGGSVAFWSLAALLPADTDGQNDAYVWRNLDAATPELKLVSKPGGEAGGVAIGDVTAAGDRVVFASVPSLHPDTEGIMGLYERVLATDAVTHLSAPLGHAGGALFGPQRTGEMDAGSQAMSADGRIVVFESDAQYLPGAVPLREQVYARDVLTGETMLVSRGAGAGGAPANLSAFDAAVSPDGSKVAFTTAAANLGGDASDIAKVYVRDLSDGSLVLASRAANGDPLNGTSLGPVLSHDGRFVAFTTGATNAGNGDADALTDVHRRDLVTGELTLISRVDGAAGAKATGGDGSFQPAIDGSGNRVAFTSSATNLHGSREVYLRDVAAGSTTLISRADGADGARDTSPNNVQDLSADGTRVAFLSSGGLEGLGASQTGVLVRDVGSSQTMLGSAPDAGLAVPAGGTFRGGLSDNGRFVWFSGNGAGWIAEEHPWSTQLTYRHDLQTGDTVLLARGPGASGALPRFGSSSSAALSGDGGCAAFDSHGIGEVVTSGASPDFEHVYYRVLEGTCPRPAPEPKPEPSPDPTPQPTASPTATPTPRPPAPKPAPVQPAKLADLLQAPGTKKCVSRRRLRTKLKAAVRAKVSKVTVQIKGKKPLTVRGSKLRAPIDLRGLPKGKFTVTITITLKDGSIVKEKRTYKTCAPKKRKR